MLHLPNEIQLFVLHISNVSPIITRLVCKKWSYLSTKPTIEDMQKITINNAHYGLSIVKWLYTMNYPLSNLLLHIAIHNNNLDLVKWLYSINPKIEDPFMSAYTSELANKPKIQEYLWSLCVFYES